MGTLRDLSGRQVEDTSIFAHDMIVLRKVDKGALDPATMEIIGDTDLLPHLQERAMPWFRQGYVANDHPRDQFVSQELVEATDGFAVARSDTGEIVRTFTGPDALVRAERAAAGARVSLAIEFDIPEDDPTIPPVPETVLDPEPLDDGQPGVFNPSVE